MGLRNFYICFYQQIENNSDFYYSNVAIARIFLKVLVAIAIIKEQSSGSKEAILLTL